MTRQTLRGFALRVGQLVFIVGLPLLIGGMWIGNPAIVVAGCSALGVAAYTVAFSQVGALL